MPSKPRRHFTTEQKVAILRRHLGNVFVPVAGERMADKDRKIADLEARLAKKDGVIAWVAEQHATLKSLGET